MDIDRSGYEVLTQDECRTLLGRTNTGRMALHVGALPTVVPVGFALVDDAIVVGGLGEDRFLAATEDAVVAFEVDDVDIPTGARWSVVVVGVADELSGLPAEESDRLRLNLGPWSDPSHGGLIRLTVHLLSGRRSRERTAA